MKNKIIFYTLLTGIFSLALFTRFGMIITPTIVFIYFTFVSILFVLFVLINDSIKASIKDPFLIFFLIAISISTIISPYKYGSFTEILRIVSALLTGILINNLVNSKQELKKNLYYIVGLGLSLAFISYLFYYSVEFASFPRLASIAEKYAFVYGDTLSSIWQYQNAFGGFLILPIFISFHQLNTEIDSVRKILWAFATIFLTFTLILTDSRGAMLVYLLCLLIYILLYKKNERLKIILNSILVILGAYVLTFFAASPNTLLRSAQKTEILAKYIAGAPNNSLAQRVYFAKFSIKMWLKHPAFGTGLGTFKDIYCKYSTLPDKIRFGPHSIVFRFITETGSIGIIAFLLLISKLFKKAFLFITKDRRFLGTFIGVLGMFLHMCIDIDYPDTIMIVLLFSILYSFIIKEQTIKIKKYAKFGLTISLLLLIGLSSLRGIAGIYALNGDRFMEEGNNAKATQYIKTAIKIDRSNDLYHYIKGSLLRTLPTINKGIGEYRKAHELHKNDYDYPLAIGKAYLDIENNNAIYYLKQAKDLYPTKASIKGLIAIYYTWIDKNNLEAEKYIKKAFSLKKDCSNAYVAIGFQYLNNDELSLAKEYFIKAAKIQYNNPYAQLGFLYCYKKINDKTRILNTMRYIKKFDSLLYQNLISAK
jgi:O-antigen ligase/Tfp pilus assembly protein PilF